MSGREEIISSVLTFLKLTHNNSKAIAMRMCFLPAFSFSCDEASTELAATCFDELSCYKMLICCTTIL